MDHVTEVGLFLLSVLVGFGSWWMKSQHERILYLERVVKTKEEAAADIGDVKQQITELKEDFKEHRKESNGKLDHILTVLAKRPL